MHGNLTPAQISQQSIVHNLKRGLLIVGKVVITKYFGFNSTVMFVLYWYSPILSSLVFLLTFCSHLVSNSHKWRLIRWKNAVVSSSYHLLFVLLAINISGEVNFNTFIWGKYSYLKIHLYFIGTSFNLGCLLVAFKLLFSSRPSFIAVFESNSDNTILVDFCALPMHG